MTTRPIPRHRRLSLLTHPSRLLSDNSQDDWMFLADALGEVEMFLRYGYIRNRAGEWVPQTVNDENVKH